MQDTNLNSLRDASSDVLAREAVKILMEHKGLDVRLYNVKEASPITDFYVNVTGRSHTQVFSLSDILKDKLAEREITPARVEGKRGDTWILVDYRDVIVNVFDKGSREFYNLDRLLPEGSSVDVTELEAEVDAKMMGRK